MTMEGMRPATEEEARRVGLVVAALPRRLEEVGEQKDLDTGDIMTALTHVLALALARLSNPRAALATAQETLAVLMEHALSMNKHERVQ
jgi:hypothetical protein